MMRFLWSQQFGTVGLCEKWYHQWVLLWKIHPIMMKICRLLMASAQRYRQTRTIKNLKLGSSSLMVLKTNFRVVFTDETRPEPQILMLYLLFICKYDIKSPLLWTSASFQVWGGGVDAHPSLERLNFLSFCAVHSSSPFWISVLFVCAA